MRAVVKTVHIKFDWQRAVEEFAEWKMNCGATNYVSVSILRTWDLFLRDRPNLTLEEPKELRKEIQGFLKDKVAAYYNKQLQAFRQFFDYLIVECEIVTENPCRGIKYRAEPFRIVDHDVQTIRELLKQPDRTTFSGLRDYVFMLLTLDTGIRPFEALQLRANDVTKNGVMIAEKVSKTRQPRILPISIQTIHAINKLLSVRHQTWDETGFIFCSQSGNRLDTRGLQLRFRQYSKDVGVTVTPYHLRHVFALTFIRNGGDVFALQRIMGHSKLDMTRHYVNLVQTDIVKSHAKASPLTTFLQENHRVRNLK